MLLTLVSLVHVSSQAQKQIFYAKTGEYNAALDYNELKLIVLRIFSVGGWIDSEQVAQKLAEGGLRVEIHAVRMALMRYFKQGLLKRRRTGGVFSYALSERGIRRLGWLETVKGGERAATA